MRILVLNPGSSSLKASVVEEPGDRSVAISERDWDADATDGARSDSVATAIEAVSSGGTVDAVGYRVAHGGSRYATATRIDDGVLTAIRELDALAPLHNLVAAQVIDVARTLLPELPHVACFDTAFHADLPEVSHRYPLPESWYRDWGVRRYGFHGLSVAWSVERTAALLGRDQGDLQLVVAHLGSGCSATAVAAGRSVSTTMGMTPLEGLMMGTRAGSIDPGILLHALRRGMSEQEVERAISHQSGLLGISGRSPSATDLEVEASRGDARSALALRMFIARASAAIAATASSLDRLDALVFTGGIGYGSALIRRGICERLAVLGVPVTPASREEADAVLARAGGMAVLCVAPREDLVIARQVLASV
ncbi:MAG TPA: acetate/propionate family kinase [Candidatus Limnocylindria bacterium]|nr:acetate/propionate family kinase [Candidatus Limnocylindria bacterium]